MFGGAANSNNFSARSRDRAESSLHLASATYLFGRRTRGRHRSNWPLDTVQIKRRGVGTQRNKLDGIWDSAASRTRGEDEIMMGSVGFRASGCNGVMGEARCFRGRSFGPTVPFNKLSEDDAAARLNETLARIRAWVSTQRRRRVAFHASLVDYTAQRSTIRRPSVRRRCSLSSPALRVVVFVAPEK